MRNNSGYAMKRIYVNEEWCLGCHLCEYECMFANSGLDKMFKLKGRTTEFIPRIKVEGEEGNAVHFAVNCRHCTNAICIKSCIAGALSKDEYGIVRRLLYLRPRLPLRRNHARPRRQGRPEMRALHRQYDGRAQLRQKLPQQRHCL